MRELLRIRNARIYLLGDVVSTFGDSALWLAMAIWMKELTGSSARAGLVMFCYVIGNLASPLGGAMADRFRRRPLLIWSNLAAGVLVLLILLVHHRSEVWLVYLVIFAYGLIGSVIGPAQNALLPALVPAASLGDANGAQQTLNTGLRLVTPLLGAGLFALVGAGPVAVIDAATFLFAVICLLALRVSEPPPEREPALRTITLALALAMLAFGFTESAGFSVVTVGLHHTAAFVGVLMTTQGAGAVAGGLCAAAILRRVPEGLMTAMALACAGGAVLLLMVPNVVVVLAGMVLAGFVGPWIGVAATTAIQRRTPSELLGRVSGAFGLSLSVPQVASVGLGAALISVVNYRVLLAAVAAAAGLAVAFLVSQREVRVTANGPQTPPATGAGPGQPGQEPGPAVA
jgi:MFS family permease